MDEVIRRLLDRLLAGTAVPFLGAGVSIPARLERRMPGLDEYRPTVDWLARAIASTLLDELLGGEASHELVWQLFGDKLAVRKRLAFARRHQPLLPAARAALLRYLVGRTQWRLDRWVEVGFWHLAQPRTVGVLRIEVMQHLEPLAAHVYLAYLARERLVTEIITTNYDTCLEKAYERSFLPRHRARYFPGAQPASALGVVASLRDYRHFGGRRDTRGQPHASLRIYKINGCATQAACHPESIILTERQLQSFRTDDWARDLFRDRVRSCALVFNGFGSDEPQIRHTALEVAREFEADGGEEPWTRANAPFMVVFDDGLSFNQQQLMHGYAEAHTRRARCRCEPCCDGRYAADGGHRMPEPTTTAKVPIENVIGGGVRSRFELQPTDERKLPADLFWRRVFQACFVRLVERAVHSQTFLKRWLLQVGVRAPAAVLGRATSLLRGAAGPQAPWFGACSHLLDPVSPERTGLSARVRETPAGGPRVMPMRLSLWLLSVTGEREAWRRTDPPGHPYFPLVDDEVLVIGTLLAVERLTGRAAMADATTLDLIVLPTDRTGLGVRLPDGKVVFLVADTFATLSDALDAPETGHRGQFIVQIVIPSVRKLPPEERAGGARPSDRPPGRLVRVPLASLLNLEDPDDVGGVYARLLRATAADPPPTTHAQLTPIEAAP